MVLAPRTMPPSEAPDAPPWAPPEDEGAPGAMSATEAWELSLPPYWARKRRPPPLTTQLTYWPPGSADVRSRFHTGRACAVV